MTEYLETLQLIRTVKLQLKEHFTINQSVIEGISWISLDAKKK